MASYLHQTENWRDRQGVEHRLADLDTRHLENIVGMLERNADGLMMRDMAAELAYLSRAIRTVTGEITNMLPQGEMAQDAYQNELDQRAADPSGWLHRTPLVRTIEQILKDRRQQT